MLRQHHMADVSEQKNIYEKKANFLKTFAKFIK